ncbi:hypothetical protein KIK84_05190 [Curvibacter sp. CHRR-16]|uniref:hypothetical protein n=1 Tax=Curvibacter sp. CHRR-16 TaxID=2835872 RepID=UPI001BD9A59E|nr:hypothetical protein [Curvibacter sp. CHRR-16]MBT0569710.1 hypothetical protein [Curvibacter sp. CHRR-16]
MLSEILFSGAAVLLTLMGIAMCFLPFILVWGAFAIYRAYIHTPDDSDTNHQEK